MRFFPRSNQQCSVTTMIETQESFNNFVFSAKVRLTNYGSEFSEFNSNELTTTDDAASHILGAMLDVDTTAATPPHAATPHAVLQCSF